MGLIRRPALRYCHVLSTRKADSLESWRRESWRSLSFESLGAVGVIGVAGVPAACGATLGAMGGCGKSVPGILGTPVPGYAKFWNAAGTPGWVTPLPTGLNLRREGRSRSRSLCGLFQSHLLTLNQLTKQSVRFLLSLLKSINSFTQARQHLKTLGSCH